MFSFLFEPCASVVTLLMTHLVFTGCCCVHLVVLLTCRDPLCLSVANTYTKGNNHSSYLFLFLALVLACVCLSQAGVCIGNHFQCKPFWFLARLVVLLACGSFRCVRMGKKAVVVHGCGGAQWSVDVDAPSHCFPYFWRASSSSCCAWRFRSIPSRALFAGR